MSVKLPWDPLIVRSCVLSGRCHTAGTEVSHRSPRRLEYLAFGPSWKCAGPRFRRPMPSAWDRVKHRKARVFLPLLSLRRCPAARRHALSFRACRGAPSSSRKLLETDFSPEDSRLLELRVPMSSSGCTWAPAPRAAGRTPRAEAGGVLAAGRGTAACQAQTPGCSGARARPQRGVPGGGRCPAEAGSPAASIRHEANQEAGLLITVPLFRKVPSCVYRCRLLGTRRTVRTCVRQLRAQTAPRI